LKQRLTPGGSLFIFGTRGTQCTGREFATGRFPSPAGDPKSADIQAQSLRGAFS